MKTTPEVWAEMVTEYEAAWAASDAALEMCERLPLTTDTPPDEAEYERLRDLAFDSEDRILAVVAPDLAGVAVQLRILGSRHFSADLNDAPMPNEDRDAAGLRNVYAAILSA